MPTPAPRSSEPPIWATADGATTLLRVKAVPGASRDTIAGTLGDRLKIRVAAPPEGGKANQAILQLLAKALGLDASSLDLTHGHASPMKTVRARASLAKLAASLALLDR